MKRDYRPHDIRFRDRIEVTPSCWLWTGQLDRYGYGRFRISGTSILAHRWSYQWARGPIATGLELDHICHTRDKSCPGGPTCPHRKCVNPDHLEPVSNRDNTLRGTSFSAANAAKTHCPQDHTYDDANTYVYRRPDGSPKCRRCRTCLREQAAMRKERERGQQC